MAAQGAGCIFCRIVAGEIPCYRVFDNQHVLAFLDVNPLSVGHTIVIPKPHAARLEDLHADAAAEVARVLGPIAKTVLSATGSTSYNLLQNNGPEAGQVVMHVHFHIIPRREGDGLGFRWNARKASPDDLAALAARFHATP